MKARLVPLYLRSKPDRGFDTQVGFLRELLEPVADILQPQRLATPLPVADGAVLPRVLGDAYAQDPYEQRDLARGGAHGSLLAGLRAVLAERLGAAAHPAVQRGRLVPCQAAPPVRDLFTPPMTSKAGQHRD